MTIDEAIAWLKEEKAHFQRMIEFFGEGPEHHWTDKVDEIVALLESLKSKSP